MADKKEEEKTEEESAPEEKKSSNMLLIIIIVVLFLIIIIGGVVTYLLMGDDSEAAQDNKQVQEKPKSKRSVSTGSNAANNNNRDLSEIGVLYPLDTFTVNLKSDAGRRYLKVTMSLELDGKDLSTELDAKTAVLRDRIIRILTSKTLEEISSKKGKQKVSQQIVDTLNSMISKGSVRAVYFTEFVIQ